MALAADKGPEPAGSGAAMSQPQCPATSSRLLDVYARLEAAYGPQHWWPGNGGFEMVAGAILTQSAAWPNVERALENLKRAGALDARRLVDMPEARLAELIRPSGYYNVKARKLRAFAQVLIEEFSGGLEHLYALPLPALRERLLAIYGIGPETADDIILYGAGQPSFVIDAYTRRIFARLGISPPGDAYEGWRSLFMRALPTDAALFNEYHALIVRHAKVSCRLRPVCADCALASICPTGQHNLTEAAAKPRSAAMSSAPLPRERYSRTGPRDGKDGRPHG